MTKLLNVYVMIKLTKYLPVRQITIRRIGVKLDVLFNNKNLHVIHQQQVYNVDVC